MARNSIFALVIFTLLVVACGSGPTATPTPIQEPTQTPGPVLPTAQELKQAGEDLFSAFFTAVDAQDGAALHALLVADIRDRTTPWHNYNRRKSCCSMTAALLPAFQGRTNPYTQ